MPDFQVVTRGLPARAEEWLWARNAPDSKLPPLSEEDKRKARIRFLSDEQYARHLLLRACARQREEREANALGEVIAAILLELDGEYRLTGLVKRGFEPGWRALIEFSPREAVERVLDIPVPTEDFSGEPGSEILRVDNPQGIRDYLLRELGRAQSSPVAS
jgi:hypothetical protein